MSVCIVVQVITSSWWECAHAVTDGSLYQYQESEIKAWYTNTKTTTETLSSTIHVCICVRVCVFVCVHVCVSVYVYYKEYIPTQPPTEQHSTWAQGDTNKEGWYCYISRFEVKCQVIYMNYPIICTGHNQWIKHM